MNEDRIIGEGKNIVGQGKEVFGDAIGNDRLQGSGVIDQISGTVQNGYGQLKDGVRDLIDDAPAAVGRLADQGRDLTRRSDAAIRDRLGDNGALYLAAGAVGLAVLGLFASRRR